MITSLSTYPRNAYAVASVTLLGVSEGDLDTLLHLVPNLVQIYARIETRPGVLTARDRGKARGESPFAGKPVVRLRIVYLKHSAGPLEATLTALSAFPRLEHLSLEGLCQVGGRGHLDIGEPSPAFGLKSLALESVVLGDFNLARILGGSHETLLRLHLQSIHYWPADSLPRFVASCANRLRSLHLDSDESIDLNVPPPAVQPDLLPEVVTITSDFPSLIAITLRDTKREVDALCAMDAPGLQSIFIHNNDLANGREDRLSDASVLCRALEDGRFPDLQRLHFFRHCGDWTKSDPVLGKLCKTLGIETGWLGNGYWWITGSGVMDLTLEQLLEDRRR